LTSPAMHSISAISVCSHLFLSKMINVHSGKQGREETIHIGLDQVRWKEIILGLA